MTAPSIGEVLALYERWGSNGYDEELTQRDHALQTAALAVRAGAPDALVVAALLHDVGHLLAQQAACGSAPPATDLTHETRGARYLAGLFPPSVSGPVALHVRAKRYRCAVDPSYRARLSEGSKRSLELQGGPLSDEAALVFGGLPGFADAVQLREWDDRAKIDGLVVAPIEAYRERLERVARR